MKSSKDNNTLRTVVMVSKILIIGPWNPKEKQHADGAVQFIYDKVGFSTEHLCEDKAPFTVSFQSNSVTVLEKQKYPHLLQHAKIIPRPLHTGTCFRDSLGLLSATIPYRCPGTVACPHKQWVLWSCCLPPTPFVFTETVACLPNTMDDLVLLSASHTPWMLWACCLSPNPSHKALKLLVLPQP